jgi:lipopolysaccharide transport system ATP-binding protein
MSDTVIRVENLSKKYIIRHQQAQQYTALRDVIADGVKSIGRRLSGAKPDLSMGSTQEEFWALKDVSFEVKQGDRIGIIGRNGAGKSTLLKILSRITEPTKGEVIINGRVASLLEVGTGFHPELTGRENIYLNGAILGMNKTEIKRKFDEIVDFAEVEQFLDTPVKHYSSGMYVRLAFAVAAHLETEILIIDEVLAVGDVTFQKKCLGKMENVAEKQGRTVLFVSHNIAAIRKLCEKAVLLSGGSIVKTGETDPVIKTYTETERNAKHMFEVPLPKDINVPGYAHKITIEDKNGNPAISIPVGNPWQVRIDFTITRNIENFVIGLGMFTSEEVPFRTSWSKPHSLVPGDYQAVFHEKTIILGAGQYPIVVGLSHNNYTFHYIKDSGMITISEFSEEIDLMNVKSVGSILNPMEIKIFNCSNPFSSLKN